MSRVIFNADDFGLCQSANAAIVQAYQHGVLNSTSLLTNMPASQDAVALWKQHGHSRHANPLQIGLHFCLTSGKSILPASKVPFLVNADGKFKYSFFGLWGQVRSQHQRATQHQIGAELAAQWDRALQLGIQPTHLDSHQHTHMIPGVAEVVCQFARQHNVPLRISQEIPPINSLVQHALRPVRSALGRLRISILNHLASLPAFQAPIPRRAQQCIGIWHSGHMTLPVLLKSLAQLPADTTTEVIVHPGLAHTPSERLPNHQMGDISRADVHFWRRPERMAELASLTSPELAAAIAKPARATKPHSEADATDRNAAFAKLAWKTH